MRRSCCAAGGTTGRTQPPLAPDEVQKNIVAGMPGPELGTADATDAALLRPERPATATVIGTSPFVYLGGTPRDGVRSSSRPTARPATYARCRPRRPHGSRARVCPPEGISIGHASLQLSAMLAAHEPRGAPFQQPTSSSNSMDCSSSGLWSQGRTVKITTGIALQWRGSRSDAPPTSRARRLDPVLPRKHTTRGRRSNNACRMPAPRGQIYKG